MVTKKEDVERTELIQYTTNLRNAFLNEKNQHAGLRITTDDIDTILTHRKLLLAAHAYPSNIFFNALKDISNLPPKLFVLFVEILQNPKITNLILATRDLDNEEKEFLQHALNVLNHDNIP